MVLNKERFRQVLVIDDDFSSLFLAQLTLEDMQVAGKVIPLQSAEAGLTLLKENCLSDPDKGSCPDLILLDINMPVMDGFDFLEELQRLGQQNLIDRVIVALTSSNSPKDRQRMQTYGVQHFVVKPITEEKVTEIMQQR
jgi:CheY-like chemotaxis protein